MALDRTKLAVDSIRTHLVESASDPLIESFFVQYLLVLFYSEMEESLRGIIKARLDAAKDHRITYFISKMSEGMIRRVKKAEINDVLKNFGCGDGDIIQQRAEDQNLQPYFDAIANRHLVSHSDGVSMTLNDFSRAVPCGEAILSIVEQAIWE